jgi:hypothetical protein
VLLSGVSGQERVVGLHHLSRDLGSVVHGKIQFGTLFLFFGQALHEKGGEAGSGASSKGMKDEESLQPGAVVCNLEDAVQDEINHLLSNGVVAPKVLVCRALLVARQALQEEGGETGSGKGLVRRAI